MALDPTELAIQREAVRLHGITPGAAARINVVVHQLEDMQSRELLAVDPNRALWRATPQGRQAIGE